MTTLNRKILIVEDEILTSKVIAKLLKKNHYNSVIVHTGEESIIKVQEDETIALIIMDIDLGNGIDGTIAAKEILKLKEIPIVFHTSHSEKEMVDKVKQITRYGYILKNPGEFILLSAVEMAFELFDAHQKSKSNEILWKFALEGSRDGVWDWNLETNEVFYSKQWKSILDYDEKDIGTKLEEWDRLIHPEDKEKCYLEINKHIEGKTEYYQTEHRLLTKNGTYKWILDRGKIFEYNKNGKPTRMIGTHTDISSIKESEEKFSTIFNTSSTFMALTNITKNKVIDVNKSFLDSLGYKKEYILKNPANYLNFWHDIKERDKAIKILSQEKKLVNFEAKVKTSSGELRDVLFSSKFIEINGENVTFSEMRDITEIKISENKLKESEKRYRLLAENITDVIWTMDLNFKFTYVSPSVFELRGYTPEEIKKQDITEVICPSSIEIVKNAFSLAFEKLNQNLPLETTYFEIEQPCRDGSTVWTEATAKPIYDNGVPIGLLGISRNINERKKAQELLKQSEQHLKEAQRIASIASWTMEKESDLLYWSEEVYNIFETTKENFQNTYQSYLTYIHKDYKDFVFSNIEKTIKNKSNYAIEYKVVLKNGKEKFIRELGEVVLAQGNYIYLTGTIQDITELKNIEIELKNKNALLSSFFDSIPDLIFFKSLDGTYLGCNKAFCEFLGTNEENIIGKKVTDFFEKALAKDFELHDEKVLKENTQLINEEWLTYANGNKQLFETLKAPLKYSNGEILGTIGVSRNITDKKEIQDKLKLNEYNLREAQRIANIGSWTWDFTTKEITWSKQLFDIFEYNVEEFKPTINNFFNWFHQDEKERVKNFVLRLLQSKEKTFEEEYRVITKSGLEKLLKGRGELIFDKNGNISELIGTVQDITEQKKSENEINRLLKEKEILLKEVHHRIKNNFATIASMLSIQSNNIKDPSLIQILKETRHRILTMVEIYDKIYKSSEFRTINIRTYLEDIIDKISSSYIVNSKIKIIKEIDDVDVSIKTSFPLGIIITELITNSLKYAFKDLPEGLIKITVSKKDSNLIVIISDNGVGISNEVIKDRKFGFGLNLVEILLNENNTIEITNNNGTTTKVTIPIL